ncbi:transcriptional regulator, TetR family [Rhodococcoides kroppenstedtii]|uniref:Transcriptional regulator, TetR family n=1 Tax=Rhodococcoides kroppenstedtii TaxID=293050 RepID=A0A1I0TQ15_9NOCA|nr:transcriptional regulator, TetR family [Rhodococcus kroppenstedtii]
MTSAHATARRAELFDAVVALFLADGFAHFTLDEIAGRLHCSKSTLYTLAPSKDELVVAAVRHFFRAATDAVDAADRAASDAGGERVTARRLAAYLGAVGEALAPASESFVSDLAAFEPTRSVYERNTAAAADRVRRHRRRRRAGRGRPRRPRDLRRRRRRVGDGVHSDPRPRPSYRLGRRHRLSRTRRPAHPRRHAMTFRLHSGRHR